MEKNHFEKKVWIFFRRFSIFPNLGSGCQIQKKTIIYEAGPRKSQLRGGMAVEAQHVCGKRF